ncbi:LysR family transcriptional regulator [Actibacterium lipolyticum]|uniref:HTH-type transcriptional regulator GltR n=1 Tax=Actibacterium lipolyticum TaxID=1524263 RepID=A0A238KIH1_9RHOB|nr:LysR family transcriptional regulator [Actibacterium lipolyticum]SMX42689.1 HTH-type transcriptional regulator GltR [Actibacterium lipolyticum]
MRVFLAVARAESLSGAGKSLKLDPATVGRRIQRLEEGLGATLFAKSQQGYALSPEGERLLTRAEQAEQAISMGTEETRGTPGQLSGSIRIGAPDGCANFLLPQVCAQICDRHPGLEVQVVAQPRVVNLSRREADMAVVVSPPDTGRLTVQKISDYKLHLAAAQEYLESHGPIKDLAALKDRRLVGYIPDMIFDKELDYLSATGSEHVELASNSVSVQLNFLRHGAGVGIVHDFALPFAPGLRKILTESFSLTRSFYLIRHSDDRKVERLNRFAAELSEGIKREVTRLEGMG